MTIVDASWIDLKEVGHYIHGSKYYNDKDKVERYIHEAFPGIGFSSVDAVLPGLGSREGKIYFFSGELYTRFDIKKGKCEDGYPSSIKGVWGIPFSQIDAAWSHPSIKNKYYMSRGDEYIRLTVDKGGFDQGYPAKISRNWRGIDFNHIGAAIRGAGSRSGKMYFFSGAQYVRYDMKNGRVDSGYPKSIIGIWSFPDSWKSETKRVQVRLIDVVCRKTEDSGPFGSNDELTVIWGGFFGDNSVKGKWRLKEIDDGEKKFFPANKSFIFDGNLSGNDPVEMIISLWDRDHGEGAEMYKKVFDQSIDAASKIDDETVEKITSVANAIKVSGVIEKILAMLDPDDHLGEEKMEKTVATLPSGKKDHVLRFRQSGADYSVRIQTKVT